MNHDLCSELLEGQREKLLKLARRIEPHVTHDDLLQPNDFPELENHPEFRYEEGVLHGIQLTIMALRSDGA
ncbi:MAG: hypothetical protein K940chlam3_00215 [Chlamydiae bacterium]|nr:hypothetical protein [Chlamydiota bacterium]